MNEEYLWDKSGAPDAEVQRLEKLLEPYRHRPKARPPARSKIPVRWLALAAAVLLAVLGYRAAFVERLETVDGAVWKNGVLVAAGERIGVGDELRTGEGARARLRLGWVGTLDLAPGSRLRLNRLDLTRQRLRLEEGSVDARIYAPPYVFTVETPGFTAFDLGCIYSLSANGAGDGSLAVRKGWVHLQLGQDRALVGEGTQTAVRGGTFAIPVRANAPRELADAAAVRDFARVLALSEKEDVVTLVNLYMHAPAGMRGPIYDKLARFYPPPAALSRERAEAGDWMFVAKWWPSFGLRSGLPVEFWETR